MARFSFRLEPVLQLRKRELDARQRDVAAVVREMTAIERHMGQVAESSRQNIRAIQSGQLPSDGHLNAPYLRSHYAHQGWLARQMVDSQVRLRTQQGKLEAERVKLREANARFKAIEKLRERQLERHRSAIRLRERKEEDETALQVMRQVKSAGLVGSVN